MSRQTPSQTVGPFFAYGLVPEGYGRPGLGRNVLAGDHTGGERIVLVGRVLDGDNAPVPDALIELWQANRHGRYAHPADQRREYPLDPHFQGFGRVGTGADGSFRFVTVKPGRVPGPDNRIQAPHLNLTVFAWGLLSHLYTRVYFDDEAGANAADPVLELVDKSRRGSLVASREPTAERVIYRFNIHLQGDAETVFFDL